MKRLTYKQLPPIVHSIVASIIKEKRQNKMYANPESVYSYYDNGWPLDIRSWVSLLTIEQRMSEEAAAELMPFMFGGDNE